MQVLWITNILFPEAQSLLEQKAELRSSGGWLLGLSEMIANNPAICLNVATVTGKVTSLTVLKGSSFRYYLLPLLGSNYIYNNQYEKYWSKVVQDCSPDIIHIHGTEFPYGLACVRACPKEKYVVSLQGIISEIAKFHTYGLAYLDIFTSGSLKDFIKGGIIKEKRIQQKRGFYEKELLLSISHVIGRTTWDLATVKGINPNIIYHKCQECLRPTFYSGQWNYQNCSPHTIFISQVTAPYKGFHQLINALVLLKDKYPDINVRIAGKKISISEQSMRGRLLNNGYHNYLIKKIRGENLHTNLQFLGPLNADEIKNELLRANVFVICSSIENSPNSLAEAQMLGTPCISSYVGGVPDMIPQKECGLLYRFEDYQMLAHHIDDIFSNSSTFNNVIMREIANKRHNKENVLSCLLKIYKEVVES